MMRILVNLNPRFFELQDKICLTHKCPHEFPSYRNQSIDLLCKIILQNNLHCLLRVIKIRSKKYLFKVLR